MPPGIPQPQNDGFREISGADDAARIVLTGKTTRKEPRIHGFTAGPAPAPPCIAENPPVRALGPLRCVLWERFAAFREKADALPMMKSYRAFEIHSPVAGPERSCQANFSYSSSGVPASTAAPAARSVSTERKPQVTNTPASPLLRAVSTSTSESPT